MNREPEGDGLLKDWDYLPMFLVSEPNPQIIIIHIFVY